jgi:hypothetical protein
VGFGLSGCTGVDLNALLSAIASVPERALARVGGGPGRGAVGVRVAPTLLDAAGAVVNRVAPLVLAVAVETVRARTLCYHFVVLILHLAALS